MTTPLNGDPFIIALPPPHVVVANTGRQEESRGRTHIHEVVPVEPLEVDVELAAGVVGIHRHDARSDGGVNPAPHRGRV